MTAREFFNTRLEEGCIINFFPHLSLDLFMTKNFLWIYFITISIFLGWSYDLQAQGYADDSLSINQMGPKELIDFGEQIIFGKVGGFKEGEVGKGMCPACHEFRKDMKRPVERAPNLFGIIARADERIKNPDFLTQDTVQTESFPGSGRANSGMEYLAESKICPSCYVVPGFEIDLGGKKRSLEPAFHKPPINLTINEMIAIDTWLYNREGLPAPPTELLRMAYEKFIEGDGDGETQVKAARTIKEIGETSRDIFYGTEGIVSGPAAPDLKSEDYPRWNLPFPFGNNRKVIWFFAQQHLYFGGLVLGILILVLFFEVKGMFGGEKETSQRYDELAKKMLSLSFKIVACGLLLGGIMLFTLSFLFSNFLSYFASVFKTSSYIYAWLLVIFPGMVYFYLNLWEKMRKGKLKLGHVGIGLLTNVLALTILGIGNSWTTFMLSPSGVDKAGYFLGNEWNALNNPLWMPLFFLRLIGNVIFAAIVMAAYAGFKGVISKTQEEKEYYDWMGYISFLVFIIGLFSIPFIGHWLSNDIIGYQRQMGITLFLGDLSWAMLTLVSLLGLVFLSTIYYVWQRINCTQHEGKYKKFEKPAFFILAVCLLVYITPSNLALTHEEFTALEGRVHPLIYGYGVESTKQAAVHIMLLAAGWSILIYWRSRFQFTIYSLSKSDWILGALFFSGAFFMIFLGSYGFGASPEERAWLTLPMTAGTIAIMLMGIAVTKVSVSKLDPIPTKRQWGMLPSRGNITLIFMALVISWIMGLGGYVRSALRGEWHVTDIVQDSSSWAFSLGQGDASFFISFNVLVFWIVLIGLFWCEKNLPFKPKVK